MSPLSLYIHTPWCVRKCPYCDFNSHAIRGELPEEAYINKLIEEFAHHNETRNIHTIFIGGGTPSLLSAHAYQRLFNVTGLAKEVTLETNPGTVEAKRFADYHSIGINRLSIGVQSFQDDKLKVLGRIHDAKEAIAAIKTAKNAGFNNFNIDLMFALPEQSIDDALQDLQQAIDLNPTHLSWYQLTLEPNTLFHKYPPKLPEDDFIVDMQTQGQALLAKHSYQQYEISAYAKPGHECKHNLNYWQFGDYLGIGAGAHSKIHQTRRWNLKHPTQYLNLPLEKIINESPIASNALVFEFLLNALRLSQPIPFALFEERTGLDRQSLIKQIQQSSKADWFEISASCLKLKQSAQAFLNEVLVDLL